MTPVGPGPPVPGASGHAGAAGAAGACAAGERADRMPSEDCAGSLAGAAAADGVRAREIPAARADG
ncbi:hypothetical protein ADK91_04410, partial [Streptomyces sp. XY511]